MKLTTQHAQIRLLALSTRWILSLALVIGVIFWALLTWMAFTSQFQRLPQMANGYMSIGIGLSYDPNGKLLAAHPFFIWGYISLALGIAGYGLLRLWRLMHMYEAGNVFDRRAPNHLSTFAICILLRELLDIVAIPLISMAINNDNHWVSFNIDSGTTHVLLITILFFLMSRIMAAAYFVADDNDGFI
ncbi:DUF2975 domain-containing protein [Undibacterium sp. SXout11W]|uniref:DUF2975 domain-containing protein n=1 Tax=Undibacterium sp. SXout11W TaxID=3413050 RepID=UPI003BEFD12D